MSTGKQRQRRMRLTRLRLCGQRRTSCSTGPQLRAAEILLDFLARKKSSGPLWPTLPSCQVRLHLRGWQSLAKCAGLKRSKAETSRPQVGSWVRIPPPASVSGFNADRIVPLGNLQGGQSTEG